MDFSIVIIEWRRLCGCICSWNTYGTANYPGQLQNQLRVSCEFELEEGLMNAVDGKFWSLSVLALKVNVILSSDHASNSTWNVLMYIHVVWRDCSLVTSGLLILISLCKCFGCRVKLFLSFPNIGKLVIWWRRISRHSPDDLPTIKVWNWGQRNFNSMEEIWKYNNRDHKHRQRNGTTTTTTTTTGESKIFPRERSVYVKTSFRLRWRLNLSRFSSWWKRR